MYKMNSTSTTTQSNCPSGSTDYISIILGTLFAASELFSLVDRIRPNGLTEAVIISIKNILQAFANVNVLPTSHTVLPTSSNAPTTPLNNDTLTEPTTEAMDVSQS